MIKQSHKFDIVSPGFKRSPGATCEAMRAAGPLIPVRLPIVGDIHFATTHASVDALLKAHDRFSVDLLTNGRTGLSTFLRWTPGPLKLLSENMLQMDGADHRRLRKLVDGAFRRTEIDALRPRIERIADDLIDKLARSNDRDLVRHVARDLPLAVICDMLGLPQEDRPRFTRWMASLSDVSSITGLARLIPAINRINTYLRNHFERRRADPGDDLISRLMATEADGDMLSANELLSMCFLLFVAGHETTTHLISGGTLALMQHREQWERLQADEELAAAATDELLRFVTPVMMTKPRIPVQDLEFEGVTLQRGQLVMGLLTSANLDPMVFEHPATLDITRTPNRHVAFGAGPHFCLGAWLARAEMEIFLQRLTNRCPDLNLAVPEDQLAWRKGTGMRALKSLPVRW